MNNDETIYLTSSVDSVKLTTEGSLGMLIKETFQAKDAFETSRLNVIQ